MKTRILTSVYIVIGLILAFVSRLWIPYIFDAVIGVLAIMGSIEIGRVFERSKQYNNIYLVGTMPALIYLGFIFAFKYNLVWQYYLIIVLGLVLLYFIFTFLLTLMTVKTTKREISKYQYEGSLAKYAFIKSINTSIIMFYPVLLFSSMFLLNHLFNLRISDTLLNTSFDFYLLLNVFIVTMFTDTMALFTGRLIKGPKLCPLISPNKTISGFIGGLVGGVAGAFAVYGIFSVNTSFMTAFGSITNLWSVAVFGLIGSIISQLGDLFASLLKRRARVKDYGTIFPGHGGVMDRVDGLIFNAAFVLIYFLIII